MTQTSKQLIDNAKIKEVEIRAVYSNDEYKGFKLAWTSDEIGWGEIDIYQFHKNKRVQFDTELMGKEFVKKVFDKLLESMDQ